MTFFRRDDGELVEGLGRVRRLMPYLMPTRTESIVLHRALYDLTRTRPWLEEYNATHERAATLFHLLLFACARALHERPGLNRFVSGGRFYQRRDVHLSFVAKKSFEDGSPLITVKLAFPPEQTFAELVAMVGERVGGARGGRKTRVDSELGLAFAVPSPVLRGALGILRTLDAANLLPGSMIADDPMFTSMFLANLGSVGIDDTFHHLYEWGNCPLFGAMGRAKKRVLVGDDDTPVIREAMYVNWTFDERVNDGHYCMASLGIVQRIFENPAEYAT